MDKEEKVVEERELSDEFVDKNENKVNLIIRIFNVILTIVVFGVVGMALIDFLNVNQEKEPMFCIKKDVITHEDGTVDVCTGIGYKVYQYKRESIKGSEFGPFWIEEKTKPLTVEQ